MKKVSIIFAVALISLALMSMGAMAADMTIKATTVEGTVEISSDGTTWSALSKDAQVNVSDTIRTKANSSCILTWAGGNAAKISALSRVKVAQASKNGTTENSALDLEQGKVFAHAKKLSDPSSSFELRTPTAVAGVRGTDTMGSNDNGNVTFGCTGGAVGVTNGAGDEALVGANQAINVDPSGNLGEVIPMPDDMAADANKNMGEVKQAAKQDEEAAKQQPQKKEEKKAQKEEKKEEKKAEKEEKKEEQKAAKEEEKAASSDDDEDDEEAAADDEDEGDDDEAMASDDEGGDDMGDDTGDDMGDDMGDEFGDDMGDDLGDDVAGDVDNILENNDTQDIIDEVEGAYKTGTVDVTIYIGDSASVQ